MPELYTNIPTLTIVDNCSGYGACVEACNFEASLLYEVNLKVLYDWSSTPFATINFCMSSTPSIINPIAESR